MAAAVARYETCRVARGGGDAPAEDMHTQEAYSIRKCPVSADCFQFEYLKMVSLTPCRRCHGEKAFRRDMLKPTCYSWIAGLDLESYGVQEDLEGYGVEWCDADTCLNHYRFHAENLARRMAEGCSKGSKRPGGGFWSD